MLFTNIRKSLVSRTGKYDCFYYSISCLKNKWLIPNFLKHSVNILHFFARPIFVQADSTCPKVKSPVQKPGIHYR
jgi:hypothetical protein